MPIAIFLPAQWLGAKRRRNTVVPKRAKSKDGAQLGLALVARVCVPTAL